jgi:hypothetical protein
MRYLIFLLVWFVYGCRYSNGKKASSGPEVRTSYKPAIKTKAYSATGQNNSAKEIDEDSLHLATMLHDCLSFAGKHRSEYAYRKKLHIWSFPYTSEAVLSFGYLFSPEKKHLIVKRMLWNTTIAEDIFLYRNTGFQPVCSQVLDNNTYLDDAIKDVNGDHQKDFLVHWYPSSGCCRRNIYNVYLYNEKTGGFRNKLEFINPTFSPSERLVRGVEYGQPGDAALYKFKWNGLKVDTVEFILPDTVSKKFHIFKHWRDHNDATAGKFLTEVPKEYHKIESYDWFEGIY